MNEELGSSKELQDAIRNTAEMIGYLAPCYAKVVLANHLDCLLKRQRDLFAAEDLYNE